MKVVASRRVLAAAWMTLLLFAGSVWSAVPMLSESGRPLPWETFRDGVLVLDFFAPQCLPCAGVSREIHQGISLHYQQRNGNAHGLPVRVLTVDIDEEDVEGAERFRTQVGVEQIYMDAAGALFESYGGRSVPLIVVLDATRGDPSGPGQVVARWEGHPGLKALRAAIDRIDGQGESASAPEIGPGHWMGVHTDGKLEAAGEALLASDFRLYQTGVTWTENRGAWDIRFQASGQRFDLDYLPAPSDLISRPSELLEDQFSLQGRFRVRFADRWQAELSGGGYDGFADYRSVWLDEYYRQYFQTVPGYLKAEPGGWNLAPGVRWEYVPSSAWLQASLVIQQDEVSPGYEVLIAQGKPPRSVLVRGTGELDTLAGSVGLENILSRRIRIQQNLRFTDTTDRDLRYEYQGLLRWAVAERWVARGTAGVTLEPPQFHAYQGQVALERDWQDRWFVGLFARYYSDDGLVRDPKIVSNASPPLETWQVGLTLRRQSERWGAQVSAGPYWNRYDPVPFISRHFSTLYADRDWLWVQAALNFRM